MCDVAHLCVWHDDFVRAAWIVEMCCMTHSYLMTCWYVRHNTRTCLSHVCDMTHAYVWFDAFICASSICDDASYLICSYVWCDTFVGNSFICDAFIHAYVWCDAFICVPLDMSCISLCVTCHISSLICHDRFMGHDSFMRSTVFLCDTSLICHDSHE